MSRYRIVAMRGSTFIEEAKVFRVLAHPVRLEILSLLTTKRLGVNEISKKLHKRQPNISQHLMILKKVGLVFADKTGKRHIYQLDHRWIQMLKQISKFTK